MAGLLIRSPGKKRMHEETNEEKEDKLEEKMSPQLSGLTAELGLYWGENITNNKYC